MTIHEAANGAKILAQWLGEGLPPDPLAQDRADVCTGRLTGKPCEYNYQGRWIFPDAVAATIQRIAEIKNRLQLRVQGEEKLGHCERCQCVLSLKIHVPRKTILNHTSGEDYAKLPPYCWIVTGSNK